MTLPAVVTTDLRLSDTLTRAVATKTDYVVGGEDSPNAGQVIEVPWTLPATITPAMIAEARRHLPNAEAEAKPPARDKIREWLGMLGVLCAGKMSADDARTKMIAYSEFLDHPAAVFTKETVQRASREFRKYGFPSHGNIAAFLDREARPILDRLHRLERLAKATPTEQPKPRGPSYQELPPDERAKVDKAVAEAKAKLAEPSRYDPKPEKVELHHRHAKQRAELSAEYAAQLRAKHGDPRDQEPLI